MSRIPDAADVWGALATIPDPEFGVNVVDLGLIYSVRCDAGNIDVVMTLTTPGCPAGSWIHDGAKQAVASLRRQQGQHQTRLRAAVGAGDVERRRAAPARPAGRLRLSRQPFDARPPGDIIEILL